MNPLRLNSFPDRIRNRIRIDRDRINLFQFMIAENTAELESAFSLVHDRYIRRGYMTPQKHGLRLSLYNALPETTTFIGKKDDLVAFTLTLFQDSELALPMDIIYHTALDKLRRQGRKIAEVGALASHKIAGKIDQSVLMHANKIMHKYARNHLGIDDLVIAINPRHQWFYENILLFEKIGELKTYDHVEKAPAIAYRLNLNTAEEKYRTAYCNQSPEKNLHRFFCHEKSNCITLPPDNKILMFWNEKRLNYFFKKKTKLFEGAGVEILSYLQSLYSDWDISSDVTCHDAMAHAEKLVPKQPVIVPRFRNPLDFPQLSDKWAPIPVG